MGHARAFETWGDAVDALLALDVPAVVIDEVPYLTETSAEFESVVQRALDQRRQVAEATPLVLCGSARAVMTRLLVGEAPLRGRAQVEMDIAAFGYRDAAAFAGLPPSVAWGVHAGAGDCRSTKRRSIDHAYVAGTPSRLVAAESDGAVTTVCVAQAPSLLAAAGTVRRDRPAGRRS